ncbi:MAG: hypothetical protein Q9166_002372 [cf. Caloplaca sp. 2 TL-2023]
MGGLSFSRYVLRSGRGIDWNTLRSSFEGNWCAMDDAEAGNESSSELPELSKVIESSLPSPSPPKKRRRKGDGTSAVHKPFKSPFRTPLKIAPASEPSIDGATPYISTHTSTPTTLLTPRFNRPIQPLPSSSSNSPTKPGSRLDKLQKQHTSLLNTLSSLRARLETTNQALEIEASSTDAELEMLIKKWRSTSREAAEEVFVGMKEKVDGMGGWKQWKRREAEGRRGWGDERDDKTKKGGDDDREREAETSRKEEEEAEKELEEEDQEGFTIETMLKSLGIPLETIGYDKELQKWDD